MLGLWSLWKPRNFSGLSFDRYSSIWLWGSMPEALSQVCPSGVEESSLKASHSASLNSRPLGKRFPIFFFASAGSVGKPPWVSGPASFGRACFASRRLRLPVAVLHLLILTALAAIHVTSPSCTGAGVVDELPGCGPGRSRPGCWEPCPAGCDVDVEGLVDVPCAAEGGALAAGIAGLGGGLS
ncbi:hypothetical protein BE20_04805 [Sorangium cellulosum]|nr:hypothetical protein BE20_04805 [Sorangium cellulosum]